ncbi:MAG: hypothetical protein IPG17_21150 [Sandaracinaceae bacterium]|nr:hypothetical protein [Sandaracinaceae bacterium]
MPNDARSSSATRQRRPRQSKPKPPRWSRSTLGLCSSVRPVTTSAYWRPSVHRPQAAVISTLGVEAKFHVVAVDPLTPITWSSV